MSSKRISGTLLIAFLAFVALAVPSRAVTCQYEGQPQSVIRSAPGFGIVFGNFHRVNSPPSCPGDPQTIQFSSTVRRHPEPFVATIETCLNSAVLLVVNNGTITFIMDDPTTGSPGVVIGNASQVPLAGCRIAR